MRKIINLILIVFIITILFGCKAKTVYVPVENIHTEKEISDRLQKDSIYILDSVFLYSKNDTVFLNKYRYIYKDKIVIDSVLIKDSVRVAVPYPVVEIREVNRLRGWQIVLMCLGGVLIGYLGYIIIRIFK